MPGRGVGRSLCSCSPLPSPSGRPHPPSPSPPPPTAAGCRSINQVLRASAATSLLLGFRSLVSRFLRYIGGGCLNRGACCFTRGCCENMARLVSTSLVRGLVRSCRASSTAAAVSRPAFQQFMTYSSGLSGDSNANGGSSSTRVAADPDTHQDFQPTSKSSDMSLQDIIAQDIKENPVLIYMKGYPDAPRCGFSALAVKVLQQYGVSISARDILSNMQLKESVKAHSNWPTFPQIFIKGEFIGGSDIILNMHQTGELKDLLGDIAQKGEQNDTS